MCNKLHTSREGTEVQQRAENLLDNGVPASVLRMDGVSPVFLICEHASNHIPAKLNNLGLAPDDRERHIAWDIGAIEVSRNLADILDATLVVQRYSRLVYDCNRPPTAPDSIPVESDNITIPGNVSLSAVDRESRIESIYTPFHSRITSLLDARAEAGRDTVIVTLHSFTRIFKGVERPLDLGVLHDTDTRLADRILTLAAANEDYATERNQPYGPKDGVAHTLQLHGMARGLMHVMFEIRNDLIAHPDGQAIWAQRIAKLVNAALEDLSPLSQSGQSGGVPIRAGSVAACVSH